MLYHNHDAFITAFTYVKRSFWFFVVRVCKIAQQLSTVGRFGFLVKYRHSFATVISLNHEISQLHCNKPGSRHRAITVKSRQIQCKHSYYDVIIIIIIIIIMMMMMMMMIIIIIITLFKSQFILAEHECSTNWGDCKPNKSNQIN